MFVCLSAVQGMQSQYGAGGSVNKAMSSFGMRPELKLREVCARHNIEVKYDEFSGSVSVSMLLFYLPILMIEGSR